MTSEKLSDSVSISSQTSSASSTKWTVHIEVRVNPRTTTSYSTIHGFVHSFITSSFERITLPSILEGWEDFPNLASTIEQITASESACPFQSLPLDEMSLQIHVYQPCKSDAFEEFSNNVSSRDDNDEVMAASVCELPNRSWEGLWDSLVYADNIKLKLLDYIHATMVFSDASVDFNLISWNRVVLLHGPPGTGKTSLCRALAQKLSIRLSHRYPHSRLLEINSHSLFSKWFSESGKLVQRLFGSISDLVEEEDTFVVVLIDEVESLTAARAGAMAGTEPSDGLRVVNALLTQLDKLKHKKNVLIVSTSNLAKAIDSAFIDRADIVQYIDLPSRDAVYQILRTCLTEIVSKGIVAQVHVPTLQEAVMYERSGSNFLPSFTTHNPSLSTDPHEKSKRVALRLLALATQCREQGMSGRALRRLPVLALARYIGIGSVTSTRSCASSSGSTTGKAGAPECADIQAAADVSIWLDGMEKVVKEQAFEQKRLDA